MKCRNCGKELTSRHELRSGLCTKCSKAFESWNNVTKKERKGNYTLNNRGD